MTFTNFVSWKIEYILEYLAVYTLVFIKIIMFVVNISVGRTFVLYNSNFFGYFVKYDNDKQTYRFELINPWCKSLENIW